jgi:hypothetical protein
MASAQDPGDKTAIAIVTLLEAEAEIRYLGLPANEVQYIKSCHAFLNSQRQEWETGATLSAHPENAVERL